MMITSKRNKELTALKIHAKVNKSRDNQVSLTTVKRHLRNADLKACVISQNLCYIQ